MLVPVSRRAVGLGASQWSSVGRGPCGAAIGGCQFSQVCWLERILGLGWISHTSLPVANEGGMATSQATLGVPCVSSCPSRGCLVSMLSPVPFSAKVPCIASATATDTVMITPCPVLCKGHLVQPLHQSPMQWPSPRERIRCPNRDKNTRYQCHK